jgi:subtilisin family serine protease
MRGLGHWRGSVLLAAALAACAPGAPPEPAPPTRAEPVVDASELVALTGGPLTADRLIERAAERGYRLERRDSLPGLDMVLLTFRLPPGADPAAVIRELERLEPGVTVGRNHAYSTGPDAGAGRAPRVYADSLLAWPAGGCPARQPVGIIDTALDPSAPGLAGARISSRTFSDDAAAAGSEHGTAVAELLAGPGRLSGARIYHAAVVGPVPGSDPAAGVDDIMRAIEWLQESGVRLVNVSLAGPYNKILDRGLRAAAQHGMVIVAAAGNDGSAGPPRYPAAFDYAIAVTAVDAELDAYERAQHGPYIDFAAPGVDVFVRVEGGRYLSGTSIATPFVTALIAAEPGGAGSVDAVRTRLAQNSVDIGAAGPDDVFGTGLATAAAPCRDPQRGIARPQ